MEIYIYIYNKSSLVYNPSSIRKYIIFLFSFSNFICEMNSKFYVLQFLLLNYKILIKLL